MKKYLLFISVIIIAASCKKNDVNGNGGSTGLPPKPIDSLRIVTDIDGNVYDTIKIGTQVWLQEGLKATHYRDGSAIPMVMSDSAWGKLTTGAYCVYNNDTSNINVYGRLYNWYAITNPSNICPVGWHIPTDSEWVVLINYLGGDSIAGAALKSTASWSLPNTNATNSSGFNGLATGYRYYNGGFADMGVLGIFWTSSSYNSNAAWYETLNYRNAELVPDIILKQAGFSCRCVKD
jgi:uncharacterized protein (TIGR02145 family)